MDEWGVEPHTIPPSTENNLKGAYYCELAAYQRVSFNFNYTSIQAVCLRRRDIPAEVYTIYRYGCICRTWIGMAGFEPAASIRRTYKSLSALSILSYIPFYAPLFSRLTQIYWMKKERCIQKMIHEGAIAMNAIPMQDAFPNTLHL